MTFSGLGAVRGRTVWSRWQDLTARHPQWWTLMLSGCAWIALVRAPGAFAHTHTTAVAHTPWTSHWAEWSLMTAAMMLPLTLLPVRIVAFRSLWNRRHRAIAGFLCGYLGSWLAFGLILSAPMSFALSALDLKPGLVFALGLGCAALWELTPVKRQALRACHRTEPLAPLGWRADLSCARYGYHLGLECTKSCWALMLTPMLVHHSVPAMAAISVVCVVERYRLENRPQLIATILAISAVILAVITLTPSM